MSKRNGARMICATILALAALLACRPAAAEPLPRFTIMTEHWVPYQFEENGVLKGIAVDLMVELLKRAGSDQSRADILLLPWVRAYRSIETQQDTILFSMTRTPERENLFRWVGPIFQNTTYLIAPKSRHIRIKSVNDLKDDNFGTVRDDASELFLTRLGIDKSRFSRNTSTELNLRMMIAGRVDFVVEGWEAFLSDAEKVGVDPKDFESVYTVDVSDVSFAFHRDTPDWIIDKFQKALNGIKADGTYRRIFERYGKTPTKSQ